MTVRTESHKKMKMWCDSLGGASIVLAASFFAFANGESPSGGVTDANADIVPKPFGSPVPIEAEGGEVRTIFMYRGNSQQDQLDPARVNYYHGLDLSLIPAPIPVLGFPNWVHKVTRRDDETFIEIEVRLTSKQLRQACAAKLRAENFELFQRQAKELGVTTMKVEVQKVPAWELFIAVQDRFTDLTLAWACKHIKGVGDKVRMEFRMKPEAVALFLKCAQEGTLQFKPFYKVRADKIITGMKRTAINFELGQEVHQSLDHKQRARHEADPRYTIHPILQDHVNKIARKIAAKVKTEIVATDPEVIAFLPADNQLIAVCFEPAATLSWSDFQKAYPNYIGQMFADYLKPFGVQQVDGDTKAIERGTQHTDEKTKHNGGGLGFSLDLGPLAIGGTGSKQNAQRVLDTIYDATGVRLTKHESRDYYVVGEVKVFQTSTGFEQKQLSNTTEVMLKKGSVDTYLEESPFCENYSTSLVDKSLDLTLKSNDHVLQLTTRLLEVQAERDRLLKNATEKTISQASEFTSIGNAPLELLNHLAIVTDPIRASGSVFDSHMRQMYLHIKAVWGWQPPGGIDATIESYWNHRDEAGGPSRREKSIAATNDIVSNASAIKTKVELTSRHLESARGMNKSLAEIVAKIAECDAEIETINVKIRAILER